MTTNNLFTTSPPAPSRTTVSTPLVAKQISLSTWSYSHLWGRCCCNDDHHHACNSTCMHAYKDPIKPWVCFHESPIVHSIARKYLVSILKNGETVIVQTKEKLFWNKKCTTRTINNVPAPLGNNPSTVHLLFVHHISAHEFSITISERSHLVLQMKHANPRQKKSAPPSMSQHRPHVVAAPHGPCSCCVLMRFQCIDDILITQL